MWKQNAAKRWKEGATLLDSHQVAWVLGIANCLVHSFAVWSLGHLGEEMSNSCRVDKGVCQGQDCQAWFEQPVPTEEQGFTNQRLSSTIFSLLIFYSFLIVFVTHCWLIVTTDFSSAVHSFIVCLPPQESKFHKNKDFLFLILVSPVAVHPAVRRS